ncbi:MAG TPA: hypothetical protein VK633_02370, partial [Verrucomicrobiae bacterium]|nr:hypothetical protein [Verrucomicrobiae bacterium]
MFAAVLFLRLIALARLTDSPLLLPSRGDMHFYNDWAQRILQGQFSDHFAFYGLPLYAYLLAAIYKLVGYGPFTPGLLQAFLEAGTAVLIYKSAVRIFAPSSPCEVGESPRHQSFANRGELIGIGAAAGWAFFVPAQAYSIILMPTAWLVFIYWFVTWKILQRDAAPGVLFSFLIGLLIGVTAMGIATILFVTPLVLAAILRRSPSTKDGRTTVLRKTAAIALLALGIALGTSPCWIHNYFTARDP